MRGQVLTLALQVGGVRLRGGDMTLPRTQLASSRVGISIIVCPIPKKVKGKVAESCPTC